MVGWELCSLAADRRHPKARCGHYAEHQPSCQWSVLLVQSGVSTLSRVNNRSERKHVAAPKRNQFPYCQLLRCWLTPPADAKKDGTRCAAWSTCGCQKRRLH